MPVNPELVQRLVREIGRSDQARDYFFDKTSDPQWIEPLRALGFFKQPPGPVRDGDMISFPRWSESQYLARCAEEAPVQVRQIIEAADPTDNPRVHEDYLKAALAMPADEAARLISLAESWLSQPQYPLLVVADQVAKLAVKLAETGYGAEGVALMAKVLDLDSGQPRDLPEADGHRVRRDAQPRFPIYDYERILAEDLPNLVAATGISTLSMVADLLDVGLELERGPDSLPEDLSWIWRPAIEDHPQNQPHRLLGLLVSAERDTARSLVETGAIGLREAVAELHRHGWKVHRRVVLNLLAELGATDIDAVGEAIANKDYMDDGNAAHEYALVVRRYFNQVSDNYRSVFLANVETGPNTHRLRQFHRDKTEADVEASVARDVRMWKWRRLGYVGEQLEPRWQRIYRELVEDFGEAEPEPLVGGVTIWTGTTSPKTVSELAQMDNRALVGLLQTWEPPRDPTAPSREGLSHSLQELVKQEPSRFAGDSQAFRLADATYTASILTGLREAAAAGRMFDWAGVIGLGQWAVAHGATPLASRSLRDDGDADWTFTRLEAAHLLKTAFQKGPAEMPIELAARAWELIRALTEDPHPTLEDEASSSMGPLNYSLNCVRAQAIECVILYALWRARHEGLLPQNGQDSKAFQSLTNAREVLEAHLDVNAEPSVAVRSVLGQYFPFLTVLDVGWARANASRIFPHEEAQRAYWQAAWDTYLISSHAYSNVFPVLRNQYELGVERLHGKRKGQEEIHPHGAEGALADHLLALYVHDDIELGDNLLRRFFARSRPELRRYMAFEVGRLLQSLQGDVRPSILPRLQSLWDRRLDAVNRGQDGAETTELEPFGWWFASGRLPDEWSLQQLEALLQQRIVPDPDHLVTERLAGLAKTYPSRTLQAMRRMLMISTDPWRPFRWVGAMRVMIETAIASQEPGAADLARILAAESVAKGLRELRDFAAAK
jgi:hypothetical protein